eukprot:TRINITY_DN1644_c2_g1_i1.p1 TRINITY_DN1644_c2_g1~~TRINITY_DN1644_c2_g1_i1.p1  ORF type:complete len:1540 (+),score=475.09 TRINITY_DN1644_c2_g1_i1:30-4649(+)
MPPDAAPPQADGTPSPRSRGVSFVDDDDPPGGGGGGGDVRGFSLAGVSVMSSDPDDPSPTQSPRARPAGPRRSLTGRARLSRVTSLRSPSGSPESSPGQQPIKPPSRHRSVASSLASESPLPATPVSPTDAFAVTVHNRTARQNKRVSLFKIGGGSDNLQEALVLMASVSGSPRKCRTVKQLGPRQLALWQLWELFKLDADPGVSRATYLWRYAFYRVRCARWKRIRWVRANYDVAEGAAKMVLRVAAKFKLLVVHRRAVKLSEHLKATEKNLAKLRHVSDASGVRVSYSRTHDPTMHNVENVKKRMALKNHAEVKELLRQLWEAAPKCPKPMADVIDKQVYKWLCRVFATALPLGEKEANFAARQAVIDEDYFLESQGNFFMDYSLFFRSLFSLIDVWSNTVEVREYTGLAARLLAAVQEAEPFTYSANVSRSYWGIWVRHRPPTAKHTKLSPAEYPYEFVDRRAKSVGSWGPPPKKLARSRSATPVQGAKDLKKWAVGSSPPTSPPEDASNITAASASPIEQFVFPTDAASPAPRAGSNDDDIFSDFDPFLPPRKSPAIGRAASPKLSGLSAASQRRGSDTIIPLDPALVAASDPSASPVTSPGDGPGDVGPYQPNRRASPSNKRKRASVVAGFAAQILLGPGSGCEKTRKKSEKALAEAFKASARTGQSMSATSLAKAVAGEDNGDQSEASGLPARRRLTSPPASSKKPREQHAGSKDARRTSSPPRSPRSGRRSSKPGHGEGGDNGAAKPDSPRGLGRRRRSSGSGYGLSRERSASLRGLILNEPELEADYAKGLGKRASLSKLRHGAPPGRDPKGRGSLLPSGADSDLVKEVESIATTSVSVPPSAQPEPLVLQDVQLKSMEAVVQALGQEAGSGQSATPQQPEWMGMVPKVCRGSFRAQYRKEVSGTLATKASQYALRRVTKPPIHAVDDEAVHLLRNKSFLELEACRQLIHGTAVSVDPLVAFKATVPLKNAESICDKLDRERDIGAKSVCRLAKNELAKQRAAMVLSPRTSLLHAVCYQGVQVVRVQAANLNTHDVAALARGAATLSTLQILDVTGNAKVGGDALPHLLTLLARVPTLVAVTAAGTTFAEHPTLVQAVTEGMLLNAARMMRYPPHLETLRQAFIPYAKPQADMRAFDGAAASDGDSEPAPMIPLAEHLQNLLEIEGYHTGAFGASYGSLVMQALLRASLRRAAAWRGRGVEAAHHPSHEDVFSVDLKHSAAGSLLPALSPPPRRGIDTTTTAAAEQYARRAALFTTLLNTVAEGYDAAFKARELGIETAAFAALRGIADESLALADAASGDDADGADPDAQTMARVAVPGEAVRVTAGHRRESMQAAVLEQNSKRLSKAKLERLRRASVETTERVHRRRQSSFSAQRPGGGGGPPVVKSEGRRRSSRVSFKRRSLASSGGVRGRASVASTRPSDGMSSSDTTEVEEVEEVEEFEEWDFLDTLQQAPSEAASEPPFEVPREALYTFRTPLADILPCGPDANHIHATAHGYGFPRAFPFTLCEAAVMISMSLARADEYNVVES